jgi:predicted transcriptional regulator YdeE
MTTTAAPRSAEHAPFTVIGLAARTTNAAEGSGAGKIGALWGQVRGGALDAPAIRDAAADADTVYAVYGDYESDHTGAYTITVGRRANAGAVARDGAALATVGGGRFLVFTADDVTPAAIIAAWQRILAHFGAGGPAPRRAYTADFERYAPDGVELWIAVQ